jgi:hypothetical protein
VSGIQIDSGDFKEIILNSTKAHVIVNLAAHFSVEKLEFQGFLNLRSNYVSDSM